MKAGLVVGGISVALSTPPNDPLERLLASRYQRFLRAIDDPVLWLTLRSRRIEAIERSQAREVIVDGESVIIRDERFHGEFTIGGRGVMELAPSIAAIDGAIETVLATIGPSHSLLLLRAAAVVSHGRGHLLLGKGSARALALARRAHRPILGAVSVALQLEESRCVMHGTPFSTEAVGCDTRSPLLATWMISGDDAENVAEPVGPAQAAGWILEHALLPAPSSQAATAFDIATQVATFGTAAAFLGLGTDRSWDRLDELGAAIGYRRALTIEQPLLRSGLLGGLEPMGEGRI